MESIKKQAVFENLEEFLSFVKCFLIKHGILKNIIADIGLAVEELLVNVISYAFPNKENGNVEVKCEIEKDLIIIIFIDNGIKFDITLIGDPDIKQPMQKRRIGGMGIYLVKNIVNDIIYQRKDNKNILTIKKRIK